MSIGRYAAARVAMADIVIQINELASLIGEVSASLRVQPHRFCFRNQPVTLPIVSPLVKQIDAADWPTVEQIMALVEQYHATSKELTDAWTLLPVRHRAELDSPDDLLTASNRVQATV